VLAGCGAVLHPGPFERRRVELLEYDSLPTEMPFSLSLSKQMTRATPDQRVRFGVELTNESDDVWRLEYYNTPPASLYTHPTTDAGYFIAPGDWGPSDAEARKPNCWTPADGFGLPAGVRHTQFRPGESNHGEISLWDESGADDCWPTGEHRLGGELNINGHRCPPAILETPEDGHPIPTAECTEDGFNFEWGFEFTVRELD
jgi:hypothetical protein